MRKISVLIIILILLGLGSMFWWQNGVSAVNKNDKAQKLFVIGKGEGVREIANSLKRQRFIKDPIVFFLLVRFNLNLDNKIQAGDHRLSPSWNAQEIAKALTQSSNDVWITIPEGYRAQEIADLLQKDIPAFKDSWRKELETNEGYLFPDTYLIPKTSSLNLIISILKNNFETKFSNVSTSSSNLDKNEIVMVASLIEREARLSQDRPLVASVIYNRLNLGMKLDIDATVQYALGYQTDEKRWWKKNLTQDDLKIDSPYNTYTNPGLPPTPISNPGLDSLEAAENPAKTDYLFYISDKNGVNHYAKTIDEQNANINKYGL